VGGGHQSPACSSHNTPELERRPGTLSGKPMCEVRRRARISSQGQASCVSGALGWVPRISRTSRVYHREEEQSPRQRPPGGGCHLAYSSSAVIYTGQRTLSRAKMTSTDAPVGWSVIRPPKSGWVRHEGVLPVFVYTDRGRGRMRIEDGKWKIENRGWVEEDHGEGR